MNQEFSNLPAGGEAGQTGQINPLDLLWFAHGALKRHWKLSILVAVAVAIPGIVVAKTLPSRYEARSKIYSSRNTFVTSELAGGRREPANEDTMRGVAESVLSRDNLLSMLREAKLVDSWPTTRSWPLRLKDQLQELVFGPLSSDDMERVLLGMLGSSIYVGKEETASIRFRVEWRDPKIAFELVSLAQRNFLNARRTEELAAITRATTLLEDELQRTDAAIEPAVRNVQDVLAKLRQRLPESASTAKIAPTPPPGGTTAAKALPAPPPSKRPAEITAKLEEIRRAQRELLEPWQRRAAEQRFALAELRATYGPEHPLVRAQEFKVKSANEEPPELRELKSNEATLLASLSEIAIADSDTGSALTRRMRVGTTAGGATSATSAALEVESLRALIEREIEDPEVSAARIRLDSVTRKAQELRQRLDAATMELATAQAGFKYRYNVVEPPELQNKPFYPNRPRLFLIALAIALACGLLAGAVRDLLGGRVIESWQISRYGVETLAEIDLRAWRPRGR
ncbi:MAG TPA: hypothetical protein VJV78_42500 [Polyangiales bacterium]|nr:hypothetical protein [Polyangiales bacterium]